MRYKIEVTRISYATSEFEVEAASREEAEEKALDEAYNTSFDEDSADYKIESVSEKEDDDEDDVEE